MIENIFPKLVNAEDFLNMRDYAIFLSRKYEAPDNARVAISLDACQLQFKSRIFWSDDEIKLISLVNNEGFSSEVSVFKYSELNDCDCGSDICELCSYDW